MHSYTLCSCVNKLSYSLMNVRLKISLAPYTFRFNNDDDEFVMYANLALALITVHNVTLSPCPGVQ